MNALAPQSVFAGQFRIVHLLSQGGFGTVYVAEQAPTGHQRALKVMHPELAHDPRARERFIQEAQLSAHIESEHVAQVVAAGIDGATGIPWLAMELLHGKDLAALITSRGRLPAAEVLEILRQLGHALAAAHRKGIVHRDLKPENVFVADARRLDAAFTVKVLDFGIARWLHENRSAASSAVLGSPLWMAPEQFDTVGNVSPATDVFALGLLAFMMLTGRGYWRASTSMSLPSLVAEVTTAPPVPASQRAAELGAQGTIPPGFDAWFARCTQRDSSLRFRDAGEALAAAAAAFDERALSATVAAPAFTPQGVTTAPQGSMPRTMAVDMSAMPFQPSTPNAGSMAWNPSAPPQPQMAALPPTGGGYGAAPPVPVWGLPPSQGGMSLSGQRPNAAPRRGGLLAVGLVLGLFVIGGGAVAAVVVSQRCASGEHRSEGHCCREGTNWSGEQRACVSPSVVAPPPPIPTPPTAPPTPPTAPLPAPNAPVGAMPTPQEPPPTPTTAPPTTNFPSTAPPPTTNFPSTAPPPSYPAAPTQPGLHACVGSWRGGLNLGTRNPGQMSINVRGVEGACALWTEYWSASGARCVYALRGCVPDGDYGIVGTGYSSSNNCVRSVSVRLSCTPTSLRFRETYRGNTDSGTLRRQ